MTLQSKKNLYAALFIIPFLFILFLNLTACGDGASSGQNSYYESIEDEDNLIEDSEEDSKDASPTEEEKADLTYDSSLAKIINNVARSVVRSFPGANTHPSFKGSVIDDTELMMRAPERFLESIERNGFLNQHNTNGASSGGANAPLIRLQTEMKFLHSPGTLLTRANPSELFPKYGFLNWKTTFGSRAQQYDFSTASPYGEVIFIFKPYVRKRTTYTMGDSLGIPSHPKNGEFLSPLSDLTNLITFQSTGVGPFYGMRPCYIESQTWGSLSLHQVREIWAPTSTFLDAVKVRLLQDMATRYSLKVYEITDAWGTLQQESYQARKYLRYDYSSTALSTNSSSYLNLNALERAYSSTFGWERAHIESAFAMTKNATVPASMKSSVQSARKTKYEGLLKVLLAVPDTFLSESEHARIITNIIFAVSAGPWLDQTTLDDLSNYLTMHPRTVSHMMKFHDSAAFINALNQIKASPSVSFARIRALLK